VSTAVITIGHGRVEHLRLQQQGLHASAVPAEHYVLVAMQDSRLATAMAHGSPAAETIEVACDPGRLALAQARNRGAQHAIAAGAQLLVFLDADCVPGVHLVDRYQRAATLVDDDALLMGPVGYLPPPPPTGYELSELARLARAHPARPVPGTDQIVDGADPRLFWSLSFAVTADCWTRLGGFDEGYRGYGAEDTDLAQQAHALNIGAVWVGGAWAYHQHHRSSGPAVEHLDEILENAAHFHSRWRWWPMSGWLTEFRDRGLIRYDAGAERWVRAGDPDGAGEMHLVSG
jgi:GT2 family glycosyltransferase